MRNKILLFIVVILSLSVFFVFPSSALDITYNRYNSNVASFMQSDSGGIVSLGRVFRQDTSKPGITSFLMTSSSPAQVGTTIITQKNGSSSTPPWVWFSYSFSQTYSGRLSVVFPLYPVWGYNYSSSATSLEHNLMDTNSWTVGQSLNHTSYTCSVDLVYSSSPGGIGETTFIQRDLPITITHYSAYGLLVTLDDTITVSPDMYLLLWFNYPNILTGTTATQDYYPAIYCSINNNVIISSPDQSTSDIVGAIVDSSGDITDAVNDLGATLGGQLSDLHVDLQNIDDSLGDIGDILGDIGSAESEYFDEVINPSESDQSSLESSKNELETQKDALESIDDALKAPDIPDVTVSLPPTADQSGIKSVMSALTSGTIIPTVLTFAASLIIVAILFFGV